MKDWFINFILNLVFWFN